MIERECQELEQRSVASAPLLADACGLDMEGFSATGLESTAARLDPLTSTDSSALKDGFTRRAAVEGLTQQPQAAAQRRPPAAKTVVQADRDKREEVCGPLFCRPLGSGDIVRWCVCLKEWRRALAKVNNEISEPSPGWPCWPSPQARS